MEVPPLVITPSLSVPAWEEVKPLVVASSAVFLRTLTLQLFLSASAAMAARGNTNSAASISAHQIAIQLWMLCSYTSDALAAASQGLVADAIDRGSTKDIHTVSKTVLLYASFLGVFLASALLVGFSTKFLLDFFTNDGAIQAALLEISTLVITAQPLNSLVFAADGILQGASEFEFQAKSMALSAAVASLCFIALETTNATDQLFNVWSALICLQAMRGLTSATKIIDDKGPIRLLS
jgi:Na+-driven multidrug efflux pump